MVARKMNKVEIQPNFANDDVAVSGALDGNTAVQPLWNGYFEEGYNKLVRMSLATRRDRRICAIAIYSMNAQIKVSIKRGIIPSAEGKQLLEALDVVRKEVADGQLKINSSFANVYEYIQTRMQEMIGEIAEYARVARSHDDQLVGDLKLWMRESCDNIDVALRSLISALVHKAEENVKTNMPANSQKSDVPVSLAHVLLSYIDMFGRDLARVRNVRERANVSPYGSMSLAGTAFAINRDAVARILGFDGITSNSIDAVTDRDFVMEFISAMSIIFTHLTRLAQDMLNWNSPGLRFIEFPSDFVKQHPTLVNKRDAEVVEMVRSKSGRVFGALMNALTVMKGLSTGTFHDLIEVAEPAFDAYDTVHSCLNIMSSVTSNFIVNRKNMKEAAQADYSTAVDLVTWLMMGPGLNIKEAEQTTKKIVQAAIAKGKKLSLLELNELQEIDSRITEEVYSVLIPSRAVISRRSIGGTNPVQVRKTIREARRRYL
jgi:argininosuccinate lyase